MAASVSQKPCNLIWVGRNISRHVDSLVVYIYPHIHTDMGVKYDANIANIANIHGRSVEELNPLMPFITMVKTRMSCCIITGLLASGTLSRANFNSIHILNNAPGALVFFNATTDDEGVCFVWHHLVSFQHAACLLHFLLFLGTLL